MKVLRVNCYRLAGLAAGFSVGWLCLSVVWKPPRQSGGPAARTFDIPPPSSSPAEWDASLGSPPRFVDVTERAKVSFLHVNGLSGKYHYLEIMGGGVALFDYDGDDFLDLYFVNGNYLDQEPSPAITNQLYRNNGDWTFTDVTEQAGVGDAGYGQGCCVGDYNRDGNPDLYVSNYGRNVLYRNNGNGTFTDVTQAAGVEDPDWGQSSSFLDYDADGWLDLYVQNYLTYSTDKDVEAFIYVGDQKLPDYPAPSSFPGSADHLYRNNGDGTFTDVTEQAGILRPGGKGMGCACYDMDDDGYVDLFVTNDGTPNYLFRNRGDGTFEETGLTAGVAFDGAGIPESSMGVDVGDYDGDGRLDMIVPCTKRQVYTLYRNQGEYFADASLGSGLAQATSDRTGFNPNFLDYDNDGDLDLFFTVGAVRSHELITAGATYEARYGLSDVLLANDGTGRFTNVSSRAGPHFQRRLIGRGAATGDLDNDGDIDLVITNLAGPAILLRNETRSGHWIKLKLIPATGSLDALGTNVSIEAGGRTQRAQVHGGVTYLSQIDRRVHFGLGGAVTVDRLEITWPDRHTQVLTDVPADQILTVEQKTDKE